MDNFKIIYKILRYINDCLQYEEFDEEHFTAAYFGISNPLFLNLLKMLVDENYVKGIRIITNKCGSDFVLIEPRLTLAGMEYLENNTMMKKAYRFLKGIKDVTPGM